VLSFVDAAAQGPAIQLSKCCASACNRTGDVAANARRERTAHQQRRHKQLRIQSFARSHTVLTIAAMPTFPFLADPPSTVIVAARLLRVTAMAWNIAPCTAVAPTRRAQLGHLAQRAPGPAIAPGLTLARSW
jgi:hypothetical protein